MRRGMCDEPKPPKYNPHPRILDQHRASMMVLINYSAPISDACDFHLAQCPAVFEKALGKKAL